MQRGRLSAILCRAMGIKGGVMMQLTDGSPRYANKELVYLGVVPEGSEQMVLDGLDYLGVISRAQDYMVVEGLKAHARDLRYAAEAEEAQRQAPPAAPADTQDPDAEYIPEERQQ